MRLRWLALLALVGLLFGSPRAGNAQTPRQLPTDLATLTAEPSQVTLNHAGARQHLLVTGRLSDGGVRDCTRLVRYASDNPAIAAVSADGLITPRAAGQTIVHATVSGLTATVPVTVRTTERPPVSFANDIMPILAKAGCNSGACHGAASGKKGFKVSLRGYDPTTDYATLTRGSEGRRLNRNDPERSLLLLKPTALVPHEGGKRFDRQSDYAEALRRWIGEGAASDLSTAPRLVNLEVTPAFRTFPRSGLQQQLLVTAHYSDGSPRDVTTEARYCSNNDSAAEPDEGGLVRMPNKGEAALMVRYGPLVRVVILVVLDHNPAFVWPNPPENNYIDRLVHAKLKQMEVPPSELSTDAEFLRRVFYDVLGLPPTPEEARAFLGDTRPDRRARLIDALLERPEHADSWALKWGDLLKVRSDLMGDKGTWGTYRWLRDNVAGNKPFDRQVRELLTAEGSCAENPAANFWRVFQNPDDAAEAAVQVFCGIRLMCAKCHDHPFEKWVQKDYYGMSAFFSQVSRKPSARSGDVVVFHGDTAALARHPGTGEALNPKFLDGAAVPVPADQDARRLLAEWLTRKDNPFLAQATVNRLWSYLFGRGIIDPVDDIRSSNPPVNEPLLAALARDFVDHNFDVRHILRTILNSRTYQLSARTNSFNRDDTHNFSHALPRRLSAEQLLDTLSQVTGIHESFSARYIGAGTVALPLGGVRAGQLPDRQLTSEMLELFGRPKGETTCSCERHEEASMTQALHLINGKSVANRLADPNGRVARLVQTPKISDEQLVQDLYLAVLCRFPNNTEQALMRRHFAANKDRLKAAQDTMWVLLNTKEFLFNH